MPATRAKQRFVTALMKKNEPVEEGCSRQDLANDPGRGMRSKRKPDTSARQRDAQENPKQAKAAHIHSGKNGGNQGYDCGVLCM